VRAGAGETPAERGKFQAASAAVVAGTSWDRTATRMVELIDALARA